jgi:hypothetical protein
LQALGCTYESGNMDLGSGPVVLYSVDVPPEADVNAVYDLLQDGEARGAWIFAEGHCRGATTDVTQ